MRESHAEAGKEEMAKIVFQKNKEIGDLFNQKNELQAEVQRLSEDQELNEMVQVENQELKDRVLKITKDTESLQLDLVKT